MANAALNKESALTVSEVIDLFKNCPPAEQCVDVAPVHVKGGEVYIFKTDDIDKQGEVNTVATISCCQYYHLRS